jgi:hypothetical protein
MKIVKSVNWKGSSLSILAGITAILLVNLWEAREGGFIKMVWDR